MWLSLTEVQVTLSAHIKVYPLLPREPNKPSARRRETERVREGEGKKKASPEMWRWADEGGKKGWCFKHKTEDGKKRWGNNEARGEQEEALAERHQEDGASSKVAADGRSLFPSVYKWRAIDKHLRCQVWSRRADLAVWLTALRLRVCDLTSHMLYCTTWNI